jgi:glucoamylase
MSRPLTLSNGNILVGLDDRGSVTDFFFPYIGVENHVRGEPHRIGVWQHNRTSWLTDEEWSVDIDLQKDTYVGDIRCYNKKTNLEILFTDIVYNEKNIFLRKATVTNHSDSTEHIQLFFHQVFSIYGTPQEDTAYYDPTKNVLIHYEGRRMFLIYAETSDTPFEEYSVGLHGIEGKEGTFKDAEDGVLSKNSIEHGHVDSVCGIPLTLHKGETKEVFYWITVGETKSEIYDLHDYILYKRPDNLISGTSKFWHAWLTRQDYISCDVKDERVLDLFKKSLFYIRGNIDNRGAILASPDSSLLQHGRDTYSYMWPRDGAMTVMALLEVGEYNISKHFFKFCNDVMEPDGYLMHKYRADKSLGSSWHSFVKDGHPILPIQEDETALVLIALWRYYEKTKDIDFIEMHYNAVIHKMATFLSEFIDESTNLPLPSYDLWEEKHGVSTFTASTVYGGLIAGAHFAKLFQKENDEVLFTKKAEQVKSGILTHLYDEKRGTFIKLLNKKNGEIIKDTIIDTSSVYGIFAYGVLDIRDERVASSILAIENHLRINTGIDGIPRYEGDRYYMQAEGISNPWYITTLWLAQYYALSAKNQEDLDKVRYWINWVVIHSPRSKVLSEQLHPFTGEQLSATPLTWSHSEYVRTIIAYYEALKRLGLCE